MTFFLKALPSFIGMTTALILFRALALSPIPLHLPDLLPDALAAARFTKYKLSSAISFTTSSSTFTDVTNASVSFTSTGRPVVITLIHSGAASEASVDCRGGSNADNQCRFKYLRDAVDLGGGMWFRLLSTNGTSANDNNWYLPPSILTHYDFPSAGTYTYKLQARTSTGGSQIAAVDDAKMLVYELP